MPAQLTLTDIKKLKKKLHGSPQESKSFLLIHFSTLSLFVPVIHQIKCYLKTCSFMTTNFTHRRAAYILTDNDNRNPNFVKP